MELVALSAAATPGAGAFVAVTVITLVPTASGTPGMDHEVAIASVPALPVSVFVQANPAFCCPSLVTEGMARHIERVTGVPVVTLTYDGTGTFQNDRILPYLRYLRPGAQKDGRTS